MLAQIIATIAWAGPRWLRENRLTVVHVGEQVARAEQRHDERARQDAAHRLVACDDDPAYSQTLTQIRQRPGYIGSSLHLSCCRAIRDAREDTSTQLELRPSGQPGLSQGGTETGGDGSCRDTCCWLFTSLCAPPPYFLSQCARCARRESRAVALPTLRASKCRA
jgi:hypothetical protein